MTVLSRQHPQHGLALGDEPALPPDQIPLADVAIGFEPGVGGIVDGDEDRDRARL